MTVRSGGDACSSANAGARHLVRLPPQPEAAEDTAIADPCALFSGTGASKQLTRGVTTGDLEGSGSHRFVTYRTRTKKPASAGYGFPSWEPGWSSAGELRRGDPRQP